MQLTAQRRLGLILGLALGLGYSLSSNLINNFFLPNIPLFVPWPGTAGLIILTTLMFGVLGLIAAWTEESLPGIIASALVGSIISSIWIILNETSNRTSAFIALFLVFLPRVFFYLPFSWLIRWLVSKLEVSAYQSIPPARRLLYVLITFLLAVFAGTFSLYPEEARQSLVKMDELIQLGMQASTRDQLPKSLQSVEGFVSNANGKYNFTLGSDPDALPVQRPVVEFGAIESFIIIRFENGFRFGCVFSPPYVLPACIDF
ncbi:MAG: hypothetical protein L0287_19015 [Anaerolineae bacterium]|nr:hypothetical protein [Anaerolineae bacterium]